MNLPLTMAGHERTYRPPRSLRDAIGAEVTAWDLFRLEHDELAGQWASATLTSVVAAAEAEGAGALGCMECLDTGFYGRADPDNPDLLLHLVRRIGDGPLETLTADGGWEPWDEVGPLEVLDADLAADLAAAVTAGACGLLRLYGPPRAFLPPSEGLTASALGSLLSADGPGSPQVRSGDSWTTYAVVHDADPGAVLDLVRYRGSEAERWGEVGWTPDTDASVLADVPAVELSDAQLEDVLAQMQPIAGDASPIVSLDPRAERLRRYWSTGRGALKIRWGTPSDWRRCYRHLRKYMGLRAKGYCQLLHRRNTGVYTGSRFNVGGNGRRRGVFGSGHQESAVHSSAGHILRVGDCFDVLGPEAVSYSAQVVDIPTLRNLTDPQRVSESVNVLQAAGVVHREDAVAVLLHGPGPEPVPAEVSSPRLADGAEVEQSLLNRSAMPAQDSPLLVSSILTPSIEEVLRAHTALPNVLDAAVCAALRDRSRWTHWPAGERVAVLLPPAVVSRAKTSGDDRTSGTLVDHTSWHSFHNTGPLAPESALLAAVRSRRMAGITEGNTDMSTAMLADGVYTEADDVNDALLQALTASAIPVAPPDEWFDDPQLTKPTTLTITDEGRVFGHLAPWGVSHIGMAGSVKAPRNRSGTYAYFRTGQLITASGKNVRVGQLTVAGGHASTDPRVTAAEAVKHYDDTASGVADVAVGEDEHGIWAAGALRPNVTPEQVRVMRACPPSGDWRPINGNLELVAACHVNVPGFPIAAAAYHGGTITALVAAGARQMAELRLAEQAEQAVVTRLAQLETLVASLVATAPQTEPAPAPDGPDPQPTQEPEVVADDDDQDPLFSDEELARADKIAKARALIEQTRRQALRDRVHAASTAAAKPPTMAERKAKPTIPGTDSFPIGNVADLRRAIQAYGRASDKPAAKKHIIRQAYKLKRPDLIPDGWRSSK